MALIDKEYLEKFEGGETVHLVDLIDKDQLVVKHLKLVVPLEEITIIPDFRAIVGRISYKTNSIVLHPEIFNYLNVEEVVVTIAHEIAHMTELSKVLREKTVIMELFAPHHKKTIEKEAMYWEAMQSARFGWDEKDYKDYLNRLYSFGMKLADYGAVEDEIARALEERPGGFYAIRRRPHDVRVSRYRRKK